MTVSVYERLLSDQLVRQAEGYLELLSTMADRWELSPAVRDPLARRALHALQRARGSYKYRAHILYLEGLALRAMERYDDAIIPLQEAAERNPENIHIWLTLGWCFKRIDRLDLAIDALERAVEADSMEAILHYNLACYWSLFGDTEMALTCLAKSLDIDPQYRDMIAGEPDFDPIRDHPSFRELASIVV